MGMYTGATRGVGPQLARFAAIGGLSTSAYLALFTASRHEVDPQTANVLASTVTAIANTAANRRLTFDAHERSGALITQIQGLVVLGLALALTGGTLAVLDSWCPRAPRSLELSVLVAANAAATALRFVLLRWWVFGPRRLPSSVSHVPGRDLNDPGSAGK